MYTFLKNVRYIPGFKEQSVSLVILCANTI